jgi:hypothetical protein
MSTKRALTIKKTPFVKFMKPGDTFIGVYKKVRKTLKGMAYEFEVVDGNAPIGINEGEAPNTTFKPLDVTVGDTVTVFGCRQIDDKLPGAVLGDKIEFVYQGKVTLANGNTPKNFSINVIED